MALVRATQIEPKIRLRAALSQFEDGLSSEQKTILRSYRDQLCNSAPDPSDVMRLTAEIDFSASTKVKGRCFGPRLTNVLQTVQQFAALGDVAVGSSQNIIACSSTTNFLPYFEKLSSLLMAIGRSSPRHQELALIYQGSKRLKSYICEYLIVAVDLCQHMYSFTQKSKLGKLVFAQVDPSINRFESDLKMWGDSIEKEIHLEIARTTHAESHQNSLFRATFARDQDSKTIQRKRQAQLKMMDLCSTYDYETSWKKIRKSGSTSVVMNETQYALWKKQEQFRTIICTGKLGSGKSVLLANIVDDLHLSTRSRDTIITFFFCRHDISESLMARTIIGSLARQLIRAVSDLDYEAHLHKKDWLGFGIQEIYDLLRQNIPSKYTAFFVLDGLDECEAKERSTLINLLQELQKSFSLYLCISARTEPNDKLNLELKTLATPVVLAMPENNPDIADFVESELKIAVDSRKLVLGNPTLILQIQSTLVAESQGMFLWVILQMEMLYEMQTDEDIRQALKDLPKDLTETFSRILRKSAMKSKSYQKRILDIVSAAFRPLTTQEFREALSVVNGDIEWNPSRILNNILSVLSSCGSLLVIDEEEFTVHFVHQSVKQFWSLQDDELAQVDEVESRIFAMNRAHREMISTTVTYLNYNIFETRLSVTNIPEVTARSALSTVVNSTTESQRIRRYAIKLLKSDSNKDHNIIKTLMEHQHDTIRHVVNKHHFYDYARQYWLPHIRSLQDRGFKLESRIIELVSTLRKKGWVEPIAEEGGEYSLLSRAIACNDYNLVFELVMVHEIDLSSETLELMQMMFLKRAEISELLIETGKINVNYVDNLGRTPLFIAAEYGLDTVVKLLINTSKVDQGWMANVGRSPVSIAAELGHETVVKLLLDTGKVDINCADDFGQTPLASAAKFGCEAVVKLLLETREVNINNQDLNERTPLHHAAMMGHKAVVLQLLATGKANVWCQDTEGHSPLSLAAWHGHKSVAQLLILRGKADINCRNAIKQTPLHLAVSYRREDVVALLLQEDEVDVDCKDVNGYTALMLAAIRGSRKILNLLLKTGKVDINSENNYGRNALDMAIDHEQQNIVYILKNAGAMESVGKIF